MFSYYLFLGFRTSMTDVSIKICFRELLLYIDMINERVVDISCLDGWQFLLEILGDFSRCLEVE